MPFAPQSGGTTQPPIISPQMYGQKPASTHAPHVFGFSYWKAAVLGLFTIVSAYFTGTFLHTYVANVPHTLEGYGGWFVLSLLFFLSFIFLSSLSIEYKSLLIPIALFSGIAFSIRFYDPTNSGLVLEGIIALIILLIFTVISVRTQLDTSIKVRFVHTISMTTSRVVFAIALLVAAVIFVGASTGTLDDNNLLFPRSLFDSSLPLFAKFSAMLLGSEMDLNLTLRQLTEQTVDNTIKQQETPDNLFRRNITPAVRENLILSSMREMKNQLSSFFGMEIKEDERHSNMMYNGLLHKFNSMDQGARNGVLITLAILFILSMQAIAFLLKIVIIPFAFLIYEILLLTKFFTVTFENKSKESVRLI